MEETTKSTAFQPPFYIMGFPRNILVDGRGEKFYEKGKDKNTTFLEIENAVFLKHVNMGEIIAYPHKPEEAKAQNMWLIFILWKTQVWSMLLRSPVSLDRYRNYFADMYVKHGSGFTDIATVNMRMTEFASKHGEKYAVAFSEGKSLTEEQAYQAKFIQNDNLFDNGFMKEVLLRNYAEVEVSTERIYAAHRDYGFISESAMQQHLQPKTFSQFTLQAAATENV